MKTTTIKNADIKLSKKCTISDGTFSATISHGHKIEITGINTNRTQPLTFSKTFMAGDDSVYDRFNLIDTGKISRITAKTVTIVAPGESHRLPLCRFVALNWNYDSDNISKYNSEEMMCI